VESKGRKAVKWSFYEKLLKRGITFVVSLFLARLLEPSDFGLLALITIFSAFASSFADLGFGQALVQKKDVTKIQYNTVFYLGVCIGVILYLIFWFSAPLIAQFYKNDIITNIVRFSSLSFIIDSFTIVNSAILFKQIKFKTFTIVMFFSSFLSGFIGVFFAYNGYGVWSLVIYGLFFSFIRAVLLWLMTDWKPGLSFSLYSIKDIWKRGLSFFNIGIINNVFSQLDNLIIGKIFNISILGLYNRAKSLQELPLNTFIMPITRPFFPMFSRIQDEPQRQRELFYKTVEMLNFVAVLGFGLMFILAENLIVILYSDKWLGSIPFFKMLILLIPIAPFNLLSTSLFKGTGKLRLLTIITIFDRFSVLFAIGFALKYGMLQYLYAFIGFKLVVYSFRIFFVQKYLGISALKMIISIVKMIVIFGLVASPIQYIYINNIYIETILKALIFISGYVFFCQVLKVKGLLLFKKEVFTYFKGIY